MGVGFLSCCNVTDSEVERCKATRSQFAKCDIKACTLTQCTKTECDSDSD